MQGASQRIRERHKEVFCHFGAEIADFIAQKIAELNKNTGKEVSEIRFTAREKMTGLESYDVKIKIM